MGVFVLLQGGMTPLQVSPVAGHGKPIDLIPIGSVPQEVKDAFQSGGLAMYNALQRERASIHNTVFAYRLDPDIAKRIRGGSGALAFAIAVMYSMLGQSIPMNIGATGAITDIKNGNVSQIDSIREKLEFAIENLEEGVLFYPHENEQDISNNEEISYRAREKNIALYPVRELNDIINYLIASKKRCWLTPTSISVIAFIFLFLFYTSISSILGMYLLERGQYSLARWHLGIARVVAFWNGNLRHLYQDFNTPLHIEAVFLVLSATGREEHYRTDQSPYNLSLSEQDMFAFRIYPSSPVYVYLYQFDADHGVKRLYPAAMGDAVLRGTATLPGKSMWFNPDSADGKITIEMVLARWPCRDLETPSDPVILKRRIGRRDRADVPALVQRVRFMLKRTR